MRHPRPVAVPLMRGEQRTFFRCTCTGNAFAPKDWGPDEGFTLREALARGCEVLTVVRKFEGAAKRSRRK